MDREMSTQEAIDAGFITPEAVLLKEDLVKTNTQLKRAIERLALCRDLINPMTMPEDLESDIKYIMEGE